MFRALLRRFKSDQRDAFFRELDLDASDPSKLFRHIRRANGASEEPTSVLKIGGTIYEGNNLPDARAGYFKDLASPKDFGYMCAFMMANSGTSVLCRLMISPYLAYKRWRR